MAQRKHFRGETQPVWLLVLRLPPNICWHTTSEANNHTLYSAGVMSSFRARLNAGAHQPQLDVSIFGSYGIISFCAGLAILPNNLNMKKQGAPYRRTLA